ncbi:MAG: protoglobin family protein [Planctomycetes bacterium]|nr:protoglobin family protein [Planctomycetota bacterium]
MHRIDESRLESDLGYRFQYLAEFMDFGADDVDGIRGAASVVAPLVPTLVDAVYQKLYNYDATWRHFLPRQSGYDGMVPASLADVTPDHPMIRYRKEHLARYLATLVTKPFDGKMVSYLDMVGKMHTPKAGSESINVPLVQMNALLGFVSDALTSAILGLGLDRATEVKTLRAFNKLLWLQNDLINRHYQDALVPAEAA